MRSRGLEFSWRVVTFFVSSTLKSPNAVVTGSDDNFTGQYSQGRLARNALLDTPTLHSFSDTVAAFSRRASSFVYCVLCIIQPMIDHD